MNVAGCPLLLQIFVSEDNLHKNLYCQTPVQSLESRLGVDFVFPLSQQEQQQEEQPHQNIVEESILEVLNLTHRLIPPQPTLAILTSC